MITTELDPVKTKRPPLAIRRTAEVSVVVVDEHSQPAEATRAPQVYDATAPELDIPALIAVARKVAQERRLGTKVQPVSVVPTVVLDEAPTVDDHKTKELPAVKPAVESTPALNLEDRIREALVAELMIHPEAKDHELQQVIDRTQKHIQLVLASEKNEKGDNIDRLIQQIVILGKLVEGLKGVLGTVKVAETAMELELRFSQFKQAYVDFHIGHSLASDLLGTETGNPNIVQWRMQLLTLTTQANSAFEQANSLEKRKDLFAALEGATNLEEIEQIVSDDNNKIVLGQLAADINADRDKRQVTYKVTETVKLIIQSIKAEGDNWWQGKLIALISGQGYDWSNLPLCVGPTLERLVTGYLASENRRLEPLFQKLFKSDAPADGWLEQLRALNWYVPNKPGNEKTCAWLATETQRFLDTVVFNQIDLSTVELPKRLNFPPLNKKIESLLRKTEAYQQLLLISHERESLKNIDSLILALRAIGKHYLLPGTGIDAKQLASVIVGIRRNWKECAFVEVRQFGGLKKTQRKRAGDELLEMLPVDVRTALSQVSKSLHFQDVIQTAFENYNPDQAALDGTRNAELIGDEIVVLYGSGVKICGKEPDIRIIGPDGKDLIDSSLTITLSTLSRSSGYSIIVTGTTAVGVFLCDEPGRVDPSKILVRNQSYPLKSNKIIQVGSNVALQYESDGELHVLRVLQQPGEGKVVASLPKAS